MSNDLNPISMDKHNLNSESMVLVREKWARAFDLRPAAPLVLMNHLIFVSGRLMSTREYHSQLNVISARNGAVIWKKEFRNQTICGATGAVLNQSCENPTESLIIVALSSTNPVKTPNELIGFNMAGVVRFRLRPQSKQISVPFVDCDTVCVTLDAQSLMFFSLQNIEDSTSIELEKGLKATAPVLNSGIAYIPCRAPRLVACNLSGQMLWKFQLKDAPESVWLNSIPLVMHDKIFAVSSAGQAVALDRQNGNLVWQRNLGASGKALSAPTTDGELVFIGACDGLYALDMLNGNEVWVKRDIGRIWARPVVSDDIIYAADGNHCICALHAKTGGKIWKHKAGKRRFEYPVIVLPSEDTVVTRVVALDRGGRLVALDSSRQAKEAALITQCEDTGSESEPTREMKTVGSRNTQPVTDAKVVPTQACAPAPQAKPLSAHPSVLNQRKQTGSPQISSVEDYAAPVNITIIGDGNVVGNGNTVRMEPPSAPSAATNPAQISTAVLRHRLQRLDGVEIESLCLDHFPEVYDKFDRGLRRDEKINLLLDHCRRNPENTRRLDGLLK